MKNKLIPDIYMILIYFSILLSGVLAVYTAEPIHEPQGKFFNNHLNVVIAMSIVSLFIIYSPNFFGLIDKLVPFILLVTFFLLIYVVFLGVTVEGSYAKRWISLGTFVIQPSEIAKLSMIIYFASVLSKKGGKLYTLKKGLLPLLIILLSISILIMLEPDSSTAILFALVGFILFYYAGIPLRYLIGSALILGLIFVIFIFNTPYMKERIYSYINPNALPDSSYQSKRANLAFSLGGETGLSDEALSEVSTHLPAAITDLIYVVIAQRFGFIGNMIVLILFLLFTIRGFIISSRSDNLFYKYLSFGITLFISLQAFINMMVATGVLPTTGMPLPFISYGRNALVVNMTMLALLLKVTRIKGEEQ